MALPELIKAQAVKLLDEFCDHERVRHQIKRTYSIRGNDISLFEERFIERRNQWTKIPVAKFKYDIKSTYWSLWWPDSKNHYTNYYDEIKGAKNPGILGTLLDEVEKDPMGIFFG